MNSSEPTFCPTAKQTREIGKGSYGKVFIAKNSKVSSVPLAYKTISISDLLFNTTELFASSVKSGIVQVLSVLNPDSCQNLHKDTFESLTEVSVYANKGSLYSMMQNKTLTIADSVRSIYHIYNEVKNLHKNSFYHLDIKPQNILMFESNRRLYPFLADLGSTRLARHFSLPEYAFALTPAYSSPRYFYEGIVDGDYDYRSAGITFVQLLFYILQIGTKNRDYERNFNVMLQEIYDFQLAKNYAYRYISKGLPSDSTIKRLINDLHSLVPSISKYIDEIDNIIRHCLFSTNIDRKLEINISKFSISHLNQYNQYREFNFERTPSSSELKKLWKMVNHTLSFGRYKTISKLSRMSFILTIFSYLYVKKAWFVDNFDENYNSSTIQTEITFLIVLLNSVMQTNMEYIYLDNKKLLPDVALYKKNIKEKRFLTDSLIDFVSTVQTFMKSSIFSINNSSKYNDILSTFESGNETDIRDIISDYHNTTFKIPEIDQSHFLDKGGN